MFLGVHKKKDHAFIKHPVIKNDIFNDIGCCDYHVSNTGHTTVEMVAENKCLSCFNICILDPGYHWLSPESYRQAGFVIRYLSIQGTCITPKSISLAKFVHYNNQLQWRLTEECIMLFLLHWKLSGLNVYWYSGLQVLNFILSCLLYKGHYNHMELCLKK